MIVPGTLYLIPNTLGAMNAADALDQIIPREARRITSELSYFVAENAKTTRAFLKLVGAGTPLSRPLQDISIRELNINTPPSELPRLLEPVLDGQDAGLISEAGVPAIADPGANLVRLAHEKNVRVRPLVGPSSILLAVMASGLSGQSFAFNGYLPVDAETRVKRLKEFEKRSRQDRQTQVFIETPYRNSALLDALVSNCHPETLICVATDLSLATESIETASAAKWKNWLKNSKGPDFHKKPTVFLLLAS